MAKNEPGWAIYKGRARYINVSFPTKREAEKELEDLLRPYPQDNVWRQNLRVDVWPPAAKTERNFSPPYGYKYADSRHGLHLLPHPYEQRVMDGINATREMHPFEVSSLLNKKYRTRERGKFTPSYVVRLRKEQ